MMIFRREWRRNRKALILWSLAMGALVLVMMSVFSQMAEQREALDQLMGAFPEGLRQAFGLDTLDLADVLGFYGVEVYPMTTLFGSIYAVILASGILSKEHADKTIEFLLSKPVTRTRILTEKLAVVLVNLLIFNGVIVLASVLSFFIFQDQDVDWALFALLSLALVLLHAFFAAAGFWLSTFITRSRTILSAGLGLVLVLYFVHIAAGMAESLDFLGYITPFQHVDAAVLLKDGSLPVIAWTALPLFILAAIAGSYAVYRRRDLAV